jgi:hypothetical protein
MPVTVERIDGQEITGWGYDDLHPEETLTIRILIGGEVAGVAKVDRELPHQDDIHRIRRRGFVVRINNLGDVISALALDNLTIEAHRESDGAGNAATPIGATFARHLLPHRRLCSAQDLFGCAELDTILDRLEVIRRRTESGSQLNAFCFDVINFIRAFFPPDLRDARFYTKAAEMSRAAGMPHATRFYEERLNRDSASPAPDDRPISDADVLGEDRVATYALLSDLVRFADAPAIDLSVPPFVTGTPDTSLLLECSVIGKAGAGKPSLRAYGFRINGFGDQDWGVDHAGRRVLVAEKLYRMDFESLRRLIDCGGILLLDMSAEGPPCLPQWSALLNTALNDLGIPPTQVLLVTQNLAFARAARNEGLRACCTTAHYYLKRGSDIANERYGSEDKMLDYIGSLLSRRAQSLDARKYVCLNYTPRWVRWAVVLSLLSNGHIDSGYVSFPGLRNKKLDVKKAEAYGMPHIRNRDRYLAQVPELLARCPLTIDVDNDSWPTPDFVFPAQAFENSFLHIVTETEMTEGSVRRVTEKILKPVFGLQPFIVAGNPGSLKLMRDLGFRTFDSIFDESYDAIIGITDRFDAMETQMLLVLEQDVATLKRMTDRVADILVHNFVHLVRIAPLLFGAAVNARLRAMVTAMAASPQGRNTVASSGSHTD